MSTAFDWWVATEIQELGGNGAKYLRDIERERALTFTESRATACQYPTALSDERFCIDSMRRQTSVSTHKQIFH